MAIEVAEAVIGALRGELAATAVNAPMVPLEVILDFIKVLNSGSCLTLLVLGDISISDYDLSCKFSDIAQWLSVFRY